MRNKSKGFVYSYSPEKLRKFMRLSIEEKFEWLEEIMTFLDEFWPSKTRKIFEKLRKGEI